MRLRSTPAPVSNFGSLLRDVTKPDRETVTMVAISTFLRCQQHIILAAFGDPSRFGLP